MSSSPGDYLYTLLTTLWNSFYFLFEIRRQKGVSLSLLFSPNHVYKTFAGICLHIHAPKVHTLLLEYISVLVAECSHSFPYAQVNYFHDHFFNMCAIILKLFELFKEVCHLNFIFLSKKSWLSS